MLTEDYVTFEIAKLLKEKGFDERVLSFYTESGLEGYMSALRATKNTELNSEFVSRPTLQMAMKWLRQKNDIAIEINVGSGSKDCWVSNVIKGYKTENGTYIQTFVKFSYEEACEAAIKYCLENLI